LTVASHELRTPLTSLQLNLQLALQRLQRQQEAPRGSANIESMVSRSLKQTHRLIEVVSDILDASRINQGRLQLRQTRVDLHQILLETLAMFDRPFADVGCRITVQLQDDVYGFWDRGRVEQVFFDLLANVLKHAPGSHVLLTSRVEENVATVTVQDDGPGIDEALHEQIFGRFGRAAECRGISGLGLGLYLCRRIVEDHGGTLEVHSKAGAGATFIARLPLGGLEGTEPGYAPNHHAGPSGAPS
jgi:signal transduction histidine kinase